MVEESKVCISCGAKTGSIKGSITFKCPSCGETPVSRCASCRKAGRPYTCPSCGFVGP